MVMHIVQIATSVAMVLSVSLVVETLNMEYGNNRGFRPSEWCMLSTCKGNSVDKYLFKCVHTRMYMIGQASL